MQIANILKCLLQQAMRSGRVLGEKKLELEVK